jgi:hypothetical protein
MVIGGSAGSSMSSFCFRRQHLGLAFHHRLAVLVEHAGADAHAVLRQLLQDFQRHRQAVAELHRAGEAQVLAEVDGARARQGGGSPR